MDKKELETLYYKYYPSLMAVALSYTHNKADAEDLVQSAFLKAYLSYKARGSFLYWVNKVLRNEFYNQVKRQKYILDQEFDLTQIASQENLLSNYIHDEEKARLAAMVSILPLPYKDVMIDSLYLQLTDEEIASSKGIKVENVRQIRSRAKKKLLKMKEESDGK